MSLCKILKFKNISVLTLHFYSAQLMKCRELTGLNLKCGRVSSVSPQGRDKFRDKLSQKSAALANFISQFKIELKFYRSSKQTLADNQKSKPQICRP